MLVASMLGCACENTAYTRVRGSLPARNADYCSAIAITEERVTILAPEVLLSVTLSRTRAGLGIISIPPFPAFNDEART